MRIVKTTFRLILIAGILVCYPVHASFKKSPNDPREYRAIELENSMQVLLISDPETDKSAAALAVRVGGASDPEEYAGMAHFLEHMLFLGTEKYPELDGYRKYIEQNGGSTNAYTSVDLTNYSFSIDPDHLEPALDQFAQFFVSPLFPHEQITRERSVVQAEYEMRLQRDSIKRWAALRNIYNPDHPAAKFITGTEKTLDGDLREAMIQFYQTHYSANLMNLVVLGTQPLDELERLVRNQFSTVRNTNINELQTSESLFSEGSLPALLKVKTLKDEKRLTLKFPIPNLTQYWREQPATYISYILGHEGKGSLLSELKESGLAEGLYAGPNDAGLDSYSFNVSIDLTEDGYEKWEEIVATVFQYIRTVQQRGIEEWRFEEQQIVGEISFRFSEVDDSKSLVNFLAALLHEYPVNDIFTALYLVEKYDPDLISSLLDNLNPENLLIVLSSPTIETNQTTPFIGAEYTFQEISENTVESWKLDITDASSWLAEPNLFLPQDLELKHADYEPIPKKILSSPGFELWHQTDTSFGVPRASFFISVRSPVTKTSVTNSVLLSLYTEDVNEQLVEFAYPALVAGLEYSLYGHSRGFSVRISGYNDNQSALLEKIMQVVKSPQFDHARFLRLRDNMMKQIENRRRDSAYHRTLSELYSIIITPNWTEDEELEALKNLEFEDIEEFSRQLLEEIQVVALAHGNVLSEEAVAMSEILTSTLFDAEKEIQVKKSDIVVLPKNGPFIRQIGVDNNDSAITMYIQGKDRSMEERVNYALLAQIIQTPFFSQLRSVQQLGYVVFSAFTLVGEVPGMMFVIQSPDVVPEKMESAIKIFLTDFHSTILSLSEEEFEAYIKGLLSEVLQKDNTLNDRSDRYWTGIDRKDYEFDDREEFASALRSIDRREFEDFVKSILMDQPNSRLIVLGYGQNHGLPEDGIRVVGTEISQIDEFKRNLVVFPPL